MVPGELAHYRYQPGTKPPPLDTDATRHTAHHIGHIHERIVHAGILHVGVTLLARHSGKW